MRVKVGFTGSRYGCTVAAQAALERLLRDLAPPELHHGDCIGADELAASIAMRLGARLIAHPPLNPKYRGQAAKLPGTEVRPAADYLDRNEHIVNETDVLVGCPIMPEQRRSGTWSAIRYARQQRKPRFVIYGDGSIVFEQPNGKTSKYVPLAA